MDNSGDLRRMNSESDRTIANMLTGENIRSLRMQGLRSFTYRNELTGVNIGFGLDPFFECKECKVTYSTESVLLEHMKHHHGRFVCTSCKQHFASEKELVTHKNTHDGFMAGAIIGGGITGAKIGALFGPVGVAIGTTAGVSAGIISSVLQKKT